MDSRASLVRSGRLALDVYPGGHAGSFSRGSCVLLSDGLAEGSGVAGPGAAPLDRTKSGGRKAGQQWPDRRLAGAAFATDCAAVLSCVSPILRLLHFYLLDAHHVEAAIGILGYARRAAGHGPLPGGVGRHVDQRMAFGQDGRTALALGGSAFRSGIDVGWADHATGLDGNNDDAFY